MKTPEDLFRESIEQYQNLILHASKISSEMTSLPPKEILERCKKLRELQKQQAEVDSFLVDVMIASGPQILDTPCIGEYQRLLDQATQCCDTISAKAKTLRNLLISEIDELKQSNKKLNTTPTPEYDKHSQQHHS